MTHLFWTNTGKLYKDIVGSAYHACSSIMTDDILKPIFADAVEPKLDSFEYLHVFRVKVGLALYTSVHFILWEQARINIFSRNIIPFFLMSS